jgi:glycosyltransferase involved in cell wall biosynthesis
VRILAIHAYYRARGGEDVSFEGETELLRQSGHEVRTFIRHNRDLAAITPGRRLRTIAWNGPAADGIINEIGSFSPDVIYLNNAFMALSPSVVEACVRSAVPVLVAVRNFRLSCTPGTLFRAGHPCTTCIGAGSFVPGVVRRCHHGSLASSAVAALSASSIRRELLKKSPAGAPVYFAAISAHVAGYLDAVGVPPSRVFVKPNTLYPDPGPGPGDNRGHGVVFVGRLEPEKGVLAAVDAFTRLPGDHPRMTVIGDGSLREKVRLAAARDARISVVSRLGHADVLARLAEARCSVVPSLWDEPFGRVAVESLARGTPAVVSDRGGLPEVVEPGVSGLVVDPEDGSALRDALGEMLERDHWAEKGRWAARLRFEDCFSPKVVGARLDEILNGLQYRTTVA